MVIKTRPLLTATEISHTNETTLRGTSIMAAAVMATNSRFNKQRRLFFKARSTAFDTAAPEMNKETFRGFYTVFWLAMIVYSIQKFMVCYQQEGILLSLSFFRLFSKDALALLVSDLVMVSFTLLSVPFSKLLVKGVLRYETSGVFLQHFGQALFLFASIYWGLAMGSVWFFTMHSLVMMMKMHSYTALNGDLSVKLRRLDHVKKCISTQQDEEELAFLEDELTQGKARYPNNVTLMNYLDFLLVPSLVYWMEYPRTTKIRPWYIIEKTMATFAGFLLLYITTERSILTKLYDPTLSELQVITEMLFPFLINYLFIFYIIFECILNGFAEISRFADRNFYDDWWNCVSYDEFARKWNKPVHHWLLRHVYAQSIDSYKLSKTNATFITFLFSSCLHEMVPVICTRRIRMYLFIMQMLQLPLIMLGRKSFIRERFWLGNTVYWISLMVGPPLLGILYCREMLWSQWIMDRLP